MTERYYFQTETREVLHEETAKEFCQICFESVPGYIVDGCSEEFGDCTLLKDITEDIERIKLADSDLDYPTDITDRYGNGMKLDNVNKPTVQQSIDSWVLLNELCELGYPHNFQHEEPWVVEYCYDVSRIIDKAMKIRNKKEKQK